MFPLFRLRRNVLSVFCRFLRLYLTIWHRFALWKALKILINLNLSSDTREATGGRSQLKIPLTQTKPLTLSCLDHNHQSAFNNLDIFNTSVPLEALAAMPDLTTISVLMMTRWSTFNHFSIPSIPVYLIRDLVITSISKQLICVLRLNMTDADCIVNLDLDHSSKLATQKSHATHHASRTSFLLFDVSPIRNKPVEHGIGSD